MKRLFVNAVMNAVVLFGRLEARVLPRSWMLAMARSAGRWIVRLSSATREALFANGRRILGEQADEATLTRFATRVVGNFGCFFVGLLRAPRDYPDVDELTRTMVGRDYGKQVIDMNRGVIGVTLHMGMYELASVLSTYFQPSAVVYRPDPYGLVEKLRSKTRMFANVREVHTDSPLFVATAMDLLRNGGSVFTAGDIGFEGEGVGDEYDFLGGRARFHAWPAKMSLAVGVPILPSFVVRCPDDGAYRVHLEKPILPETGRDVDGIMRELIAVYERYVTMYPEEWLILHRYWTH